MIDLDLATEYAAVQAAYSYHISRDEMVAIALDGVEASWLDEGDKAVLRRRVEEAATALRPDE